MNADESSKINQSEASQETIMVIDDALTRTGVRLEIIPEADRDAVITELQITAEILSRRATAYDPPEVPAEALPVAF